VGPSLSGIAAAAAQTIKSTDYHGQAKTPEQYIHESIVSPNVYVVAGFQPNVMYQNYGKDLTASDINDLVAYLMTLK
jgi:nitric oxide reductase subunit C